VDAPHQHPPEGACLPSCPGWKEGALQLFSLQHRHAEMLEACRLADAVEFVVVNPSESGVKLPGYLAEEELVRLNLVVPHDTEELLLDEWGIRCTLTLRAQRFECGLPWRSVLAGRLRPRKRPRFELIEGGKKD